MAALARCAALVSGSIAAKAWESFSGSSMSRSSACAPFFFSAAAKSRL